MRLEGLETHHAEIRRDERDEYVYINLGSGPPGRVDGQPVSQKPLRTGDRIELGDWTLSYFGKSSPTMAFPSAGVTAATRIRFWTSRGHEAPLPREAATAPPMIPASTSNG